MIAITKPELTRFIYFDISTSFGDYYCSASRCQGHMKAELQVHYTRKIPHIPRERKIYFSGTLFFIVPGTGLPELLRNKFLIATSELLEMERLIAPHLQVNI